MQYAVLSHIEKMAHPGHPLQQHGASAAVLPIGGGKSAIGDAHAIAHGIFSLTIVPLLSDGSNQATKKCGHTQQDRWPTSSILSISTIIGQKTTTGTRRWSTLWSSLWLKANRFINIDIIIPNGDCTAVMRKMKWFAWSHSHRRHCHNFKKTKNQNNYDGRIRMSQLAGNIFVFKTVCRTSHTEGGKLFFIVAFWTSNDITMVGTIGLDIRISSNPFETILYDCIFYTYMYMDTAVAWFVGIRQLGKVVARYHHAPPRRT